jgi:leucyl aminopeptidase
VKRVQLTAIPYGASSGTLIFLSDKASLDQLSTVLSTGEMAFLRQAAEQDTHTFFFPRSDASVLVRLLKKEHTSAATAESARIAGNAILRELRQYKISSVTLRNTCEDDYSLAFAEGLALGSYQFLKYFTQPAKKEKVLNDIQIESALEANVAELNALLEAVFLARDLVNEPYSFLDAPRLAEMAAETAQKFGFDIEILGKEKIEALKMGGILAVSKGSVAPPQFCILEYKPETAKNVQPVVLIGKGVVYDTGGLSLKPSEAMDYMKCDMAGAAAVIGAFAAVAANRLPVHLVGLLPLTDNVIGSGVFAPGDVIRMHSGTTVEVLNTDAEGRLILADALHYAKKYTPELVLDLATLTGAAVRALGTQAICYMGTAPKAIKTSLEDSGWETYERLVEFPLWKEFDEELKSNIADLKNLGTPNAAMITAGKFLEHFTGEYPWLHLDIAGPAYLRSANSYRTKDGTGVGVRLLYNFLKKQYV